MSTFISQKWSLAGKTLAQVVEDIYTLARSAGYTRNEALDTIEKGLQEWMDGHESCWERLAQAETARNEQLRISLISLRDRINLALRDGT